MKKLGVTDGKKVEYRLEGEGPTVLILDGGHTHCDSFNAYEKSFLGSGYQIVVPSRPGYGKTPSETGKSAEEFADVLVHLLDDLGIDQVIVIGISAGGRTATQLAGRHFSRVKKLLLLSALGHEQWPDKKTRLMSYVLFNSLAEKYVWFLFRYILNRKPQSMLKGMIGSLTTLNPATVMKKMNEAQMESMVQYFQAQRSGSGFMHDLRHKSGNLQLITAPTLIIHSKFDKSVDVSHAEYLSIHIKNSELYLSEAEHHLIWFTSEHERIEQKIHQFIEGETR